MIENPGLLPIRPLPNVSTGVAPAGTGAADIGKQFQTFLNEAIQDIADQQKQVDQLSQQFAAGRAVDVHQLMIASERASLTLELTVQVRNKVIEAYQEIMRTQI